MRIRIIDLLIEYERGYVNMLERMWEGAKDVLNEKYFHNRFHQEWEK